MCDMHDRKPGNLRPSISGWECQTGSTMKNTMVDTNLTSRTRTSTFSVDIWEQTNRRTSRMQATAYSRA